MAVTKIMQSKEVALYFLRGEYNIGTISINSKDYLQDYMIRRNIEERIVSGEKAAFSCFKSCQNDEN